jgi:hypothetical protein
VATTEYIAFGAVGGTGPPGKLSDGQGGTRRGAKTTYSGSCGIGGDITTSSTRSSGGDNDFGSGGAAARAPRRRSHIKAATTPCPNTLAPGNATGVVCYARLDALLGSKIKRLASCAGLINIYSKESLTQRVFSSHYGIVRVPLVLNRNFTWEAESTYQNCNVHRDICVAKNVVRSCSDNCCSLIAYGTDNKELHPTRENLFADEFALLHTPVSAKTTFTLENFVICGVSITIFSA